MSKLNKPAQSLIIFSMLVIGSLILNACQVYNGYPTATPEPTQPPIITASPTPGKLIYPTLTPAPALPTLTPRPTLAEVAPNITSTKQATIKGAFDTIFTNFYRTINSADLYEVGLQSLQDTLKNENIRNPKVDIPNFTGDQTKDWDLFWQSYLLTVSRYQGQVSEDKLAYGVIAGITNSLQECHTAFYTPDQGNDVFGKIYGVNDSAGLGVSLVKGDNGLIIAHVLPDSAADKANLKAGDTIVEVNGQSLNIKSLQEAVSLLRGTNSRVGTKVNLKIQPVSSSSSTNPSSVAVTRNEVTSYTIENRLINGDVGYIRFNSFPLTNPTTKIDYTKQLDQTINDFEQKNVKGILLDVRDTQYGTLHTVQAYVSRFISGDKLVYLQTLWQPTVDSQDTPTATATTTATAPAEVNQIIPMPSSSSNKPTDKPLALLVNEGTSGEAEIFAYILQSNKLAKVFGATTAGCPTSASPIALDDDSVINISSFRLMQGSSDLYAPVTEVTPDEQVVFDAKSIQQGHDTQIDKAVQYLETK
jgi:carboxyl-terminal processing protease